MQTHELSYQELRTRWGYVPAAEAGTMSRLLRRLREHFCYSDVDQRCRFGLSEWDFRRLERMPIPRADDFAGDVRKMALTCKVKNRSRFTEAMEQARTLFGLS